MIKEIVKVKKFNELLQGKSLSEVVRRCCGEMLGQGLYRDVYVLKQNPNYVIKIERDMSTGDFANVSEWRNYINNKDWDYLGKWLAPCELINQTGQILIQRRVEHRKRKDYPKYIPKLFTDTKLKNFGWIEDDFVCCDYSYLLQVVVNKSLSQRPMKYAKWWGTLK